MQFPEGGEWAGLGDEANLTTCKVYRVCSAKFNLQYYFYNAIGSSVYITLTYTTVIRAQSPRQRQR